MKEGKTIHNSQLTMHNCKEGYKKTELGWIPGQWESTTIGKCGEVFGGNAFKSTKFKTEQNNDSYQVIRMGNVQQGKLDLNKNPVYLDIVDIDGKDEKYILNESDILISLTGTVNKTDYGNISWVDKNNKYLLNQRVACFRSNSNEYLSRYYYYLMQGEKFREQFFQLGVGGTGNQANVSISDFNNIKVYKIPLKEQQKIAEILSTVDSEIDDTDKLIEKTKELKKGLMQRLLTKGIGHTEFKKTEIGEIPVEWEVVNLEDVVEIVNGGTPSTTIVEYWSEDEIPWATPTDITAGSKYINKTERYISSEGLKNSSATLLPVNSILMTSRATIGEKSINSIPMATNQGFKSLICSTRIDYEFLYYYLDILKPYFISKSSGSTFLEISKKEVANTKVALPNFIEQKKITNILSSVDTQIEEYENKKFKLEELKKGLMQQLLTGKIRVMV